MDYQYDNRALPINSPTNAFSSNKDTSPAFTRATKNYQNEMALQNMYFSNNPNSSPQAFNDDNEAFRVYVRIRPLNNKEQTPQNNKKRLTVTKADDTTIYLLAPSVLLESPYVPEKSYNFDRIFNSEASTIEIYQNALVPALDKVLNGYNSTILAYGMTGAGKTFTMFGDIFNTMGGINANPGIVSLAVKDLFRSFQTGPNRDFDFTIKLSYLEIYNEHARDLLSQSNDDLMIIEDPQRGIVIPNLSEFPISTHDEILRYILYGNARRVMASTNANQFSSRSHAIIQLSVEKRERNVPDSYLQSKLCLVDLAGSERAAVSDNKGIRQREGANINRSLLALGNCINVLSDPQKKGAFVPYRDSKLTRLLKDSLGGNTRTIMLACISPSCLAYEETVNTLKYASGARNIKRKVTQNVKEVELHASEYKAIIENLKAEVSLLKDKLVEKDSLQEDSLNLRDSKFASSEYLVKIDTCLDDLGKKLLGIFEESWEVSQSINDLKSLREQNDTLLRNKVQELEQAVGDVPNYNKITEEIVALKEVMANNENILKEMEENLKISSEEKNLVQGQILEIISQSSSRVGAGLKNARSEERLAHINKSFKLLEMESQLLESNFLMSRKEIPSLAIPNQESTHIKDEKIRDLEEELKLMKKQLDEKDKLLAKNEQILKHYKVETPTSANFFSAKNPSNYSPTKAANKSAANTPKGNPVNGPIKFDRSQETFTITSSNNKAYSGRIKGVTPSSRISHANTINAFKSPERSTTTANFSNSTGASTIYSKLAEQQKKKAAVAVEEDEQSSSKASQTSHKRLQSTKSSSNLNKPGHKKTKSKQQSSFGSSFVSIEELKNYSESLNKMKFENSAKQQGAETAVNYLKYQSRKNKLEENKYHFPQYQIVDSFSPNNFRSVRTPHTHTSTNFSSVRGYESVGGTGERNPYLQLQLQQQQEQVELLNAEVITLDKSPSKHINSSPDLSSIGKSMEISRDLSVKEILLDNFEHEEQQHGNLMEQVERNEFKERENNQIKIVENPYPKKEVQVQVQEQVKRQFSGIVSPKQVYLNLKVEMGGEEIKKKKRENEREFLEFIKPFVDTEDTEFRRTADFRNSTSPKGLLQIQIPPTGLETDKIGKEEPKSRKAIDSINLSARLKDLKDEISPKLRYSIRSIGSDIPQFEFSIPEHAVKTEGNEKVRHSLQSRDAMRELVKSFRAKLHRLATTAENTELDESLFKEIESFVFEYKSGNQTYPLTAADQTALQKLEEIVAEGFKPPIAQNTEIYHSIQAEETVTETDTQPVIQTEGLQSVQNETYQLGQTDITDVSPQKGGYLNPHKYLQGDTISIVGATDMSRDLRSQHPTDRENQQDQEHVIEKTLVEREIIQEREVIQEVSVKKAAPLVYLSVNDASSEVPEIEESEYGALTSRRTHKQQEEEIVEPPHENQNENEENEENNTNYQEIEDLSPLVESPVVKRRNLSMAQAGGDNEDVVSFASSPEKLMRNPKIETPIKTEEAQVQSQIQAQPVQPEIKSPTKSPTKIFNPPGAGKTGTYIFVGLISIALLLLLNSVFNFSTNTSEDFQDIFGENEK